MGDPEKKKKERGGVRDEGREEEGRGVLCIVRE